MRAVHVAVVLLGALGCSHVPVRRSLVGGELVRGNPCRPTLPTAPPQRCDPPVWKDAAPCSASVSVLVVDLQGRPISQAQVIARANTSQHAAEETLAVYHYESAPVLTDPRGRARVCDPRDLAPRPKLDLLPFGLCAINANGIGGGFEFRGEETLEASKGGQSTQGLKFDDDPIRLTLPVATDPPR